jgi:hypothetical protein
MKSVPIWEDIKYGANMWKLKHIEFLKIKFGSLEAIANDGNLP